MEDNKMIATEHAAPEKSAYDVKKSWIDKKCNAYNDLLELSELDNEQLSNEEDKNAMCALETVLKYGSFADGAKAIKHFGTYSMFKQLLEA